MKLWQLGYWRTVGCLGFLRWLPPPRKKLPVKEEGQFTYHIKANLPIFLVTACLLETSWEIPSWKRRKVKITVAVLITLFCALDMQSHFCSCLVKNYCCYFLSWANCFVVTLKFCIFGLTLKDILKKHFLSFFFFLLSKAPGKTASTAHFVQGTTRMSAPESSTEHMEVRTYF